MTEDPNLWFNALVTENPSQNFEGFAELVPSALLLAEAPSLFVPATLMAPFVSSAFLDQSSQLYNVEHEHLIDARIGYLFTNVELSRRGKAIMGTAEMPARFTGNKWSKGRYEQQLQEWFGGDEVVDFIITLCAPYVLQMNVLSQLALLEHELYHCGQQYDKYECPKFREDGRPLYTLRGHDVEEFTGIVRRYGSQVLDKDFILAIYGDPELGLVNFAGVCGNCVRD